MIWTGMISKKVFRLFSTLAQKQPWIFKRRTEIENLLLSDCSDIDQQEFLCHLLQRFNYFDNDSFYDLLNKLGAALLRHA